MARPRTKAARSGGPLKDARVLVVEARFYNDIADMLLKGATRELRKAGSSFDCISVPGALEIPPAIAIALDAAEARGTPYDGVVALGCVIRGETSHYDIVAGESARGLMSIGMMHRLPVGNGILTVEDEDQAVVRADPTQGDKGGSAARAALALHALREQYAP